MIQIIQANTVSRSYQQSLVRGGTAVQTVTYRPGRVILESLSQWVVDLHAERLRAKFPEVQFTISTV